MPHQTPNAAAAAPGIQTFAFGDPEPALNQTLYDYVGVWSFGSQWYEPPVAFSGLAKCLDSSPHHASAIAVKRNILSSLMQPSELLSRATFAAAAYDYLLFGNAFLERVVSRTGKALTLRHAMAYHTRVGQVAGEYWRMLDGGGGQPDAGRDFWGAGAVGAELYAPGQVCHLQEPDPKQNVYGKPEYFAALQAAWLNEAATLFRRKYYVNGTHAGYILYITDPLQKQEDIDELTARMRQAKGPGNFKNLLVYSPNGKEKGVQLIHTSEAAAKDEFLRIKSVSRDDVLAAHRVPPQLLGLVPENAGGFGNARDAMTVFYELEIVPLQDKLAAAINAFMGEAVLRWRTPAWAAPPDAKLAPVPVTL